jgi:hypothetical protein
VTSVNASHTPNGAWPTRSDSDVAGVEDNGKAMNVIWSRSPERRLRRLERRIAKLAEHLENSAVSISAIPMRDAWLEKLHDAIVHEEIRHRAFPDNSVSLGDLSVRMNHLDSEERKRVLQHIASPQALNEAECIIYVPQGAPVIRVFERRGAVRAPDIYALALDVLLRRYMLDQSTGSDMVLLIEAPAGLAACMELDGWLPRGEAAGPVDEAERETLISLWDGGSSRVYTDAVELLDAAKRL